MHDPFPSYQFIEGEVSTFDKCELIDVRTEGKKIYYRIWCWSGDHPLKWKGTTKLFFEVFVDSIISRFSSIDKAGNFCVKPYLSTRDAELIKKCVIGKIDIKLFEMAR